MCLSDHGPWNVEHGGASKSALLKCDKGAEQLRAATSRSNFVVLGQTGAGKLLRDVAPLPFEGAKVQDVETLLRNR